MDDGKLLYPKGYTFNPLTYVSMPQRLIVVHSRDLNWALGHARASDWILLAGGGPEVMLGDIRPEQFLTGAGEEDGFFDALGNGPVSATDPRVLGGDLVGAGLEPRR